MMTRFLAVASLLLSSTLAFSQSTTSNDSTATEIVSPWTKSWVVSLRGNQANYKDWSPGGVNSSAFVLSTKFNAKYTASKFSNTIRANLRFGQVNQKDIGIEKTEDLILISNKIDYFLDSGTWTAFFEASFRTQFARGFDFDGQLISDFLSPGYFIESLGISHQPNDNFNFQLGVGLKQTTVEADGLDEFYGLVEDQDVRWEGGMTFALSYRKEIFKNFTLETELSTFTNLTNSWKSTDVYMTNVLIGEINSFLTSSLEWSFIYDDDFDTILQSMRVISLGVQVKLF